MWCRICGMHLALGVARVISGKQVISHKGNSALT